MDGSTRVTGPVACAMGPPSKPVRGEGYLRPAFWRFKPILDEALSEYEKNTGNDLLNNWLTKEIQSCNTVEEVLGIIQDEANAFDKFRDGDKTLMKWIGPSLRVAYKISSILGSDALSVRILSHDDLRRL